MVQAIKLDSEQNKLVKDNVALAKFLARKRWEMAPTSLDYEELISLAYMGLTSAAQRWRAYCEENGYSEESIVSGQYFSIFARKRIIGSILDWQKKDADHVPRSYRTDYKIVQRAGYPDNVKDHAELSRITALSVDRIKQVISAVERAPVSFDEMAEVNETPASSQDVESSALLSSVGAAVAATVSKLPELTQVILALRYFEGFELQGIANELDIALSVVRDTHNEAIEIVYAAVVAAVID